MIGLDTNVLVRYLADDDPIQSPLAAKFIEGRIAAGERLYVSTVVMAETAWVLQRVLGWRGAQLAAILEQILAVDELVIEHEHEILEAILAVRDRRCDFTDALIAGLGRGAGCVHTITFDRKASRLPGFELV